MKRPAGLFCALAGTAILAAGCRMEQILPEEEVIEGPDFITVALSGSDGDAATKTTYNFEGGVLKGTWNQGDIVSVVPGCSFFNHAAVYEATTGGERTTSFSKRQDIGVLCTPYGIYYPGESIKSDIQFMNFSYLGQVQTKSDPTGHIGNFFSMRTESDNYETVSFENADMSACLRLNLTGTTFNNPSRINVTINGSGYFFTNNYLPSYYYCGDYEAVDGLQHSKTITLDLDGYSSETSLVAYIVMSNKDVELGAGDQITVAVTCEDGLFSSTELITSPTTLKGGYCHNLSLDSWASSEADMNDWSAFETAVTLQTHTQGSGMDLVIMGDGFIKADHDNGTYEAIMRQAMDEFFSVEPLTSFKDWFDVYYVKAVSPQRLDAQDIGVNGATNSGNLTRFSVSFEQGSTSISGDTDKIMEFARKALTTNTDERMRNATIVVMANAPARAGTCYNSWYNNSNDYGEACAIAFCALGHDAEERVELMHHEICGHGFGKLADEYSYPISSFSSSWWSTLAERHTKGLFRNVDKYINEHFRSLFDPSSAFATMPLTEAGEILWNDMMGTANEYESPEKEGLGFYEGAYTYSTGFCRPTENGYNSIMNHNTGIFNAISRRQIYYRIMCLAGTPAGPFGSAEELEDFLHWDAANFHYPSLSSMPAARLNSVEIDERLPLAPPVFIQGNWDGNGVFTPLQK